MNIPLIPCISKKTAAPQPVTPRLGGILDSFLNGLLAWSQGHEVILGEEYIHCQNEGVDIYNAHGAMIHTWYLQISSYRHCISIHSTAFTIYILKTWLMAWLSRHKRTVFQCFSLVFLPGKLLCHQLLSTLWSDITNNTVNALKLTKCILNKKKYGLSFQNELADQLFPLKWLWTANIVVNWLYLVTKWVGFKRRSNRYNLKRSK